MATAYGLYQVHNEDGVLAYIGSTKLKLEWLEDNHRNWQSKNYSETKFRRALVDQGENWQFSWAQEPRVMSREQIEIEEGALIRFARPLYNISMKPYERSVHEGRYEKSF